MYRAIDQPFCILILAGVVERAASIDKELKCGLAGGLFGIQQAGGSAGGAVPLELS